MSNVNHHKRQEYCRTRLKYRDSRLPTAVKVYTVADESRYLLVFGVPKINLHAEVKKEFSRYGPLRSVVLITNEMHSDANREFELEPFTDVYRVIFEKLEHARRAKKFSDAKNFYGGILHVSYATECETVDDLREKLQQRCREVQFRLKINARAQVPLTAKRKYDLDSGEYLAVAAKKLC